MKYASIMIEWRENGERCRWEGKTMTIAEAKQRARVWGYREPKWWEFWCESPTISVAMFSDNYFVL